MTTSEMIQSLMAVISATIAWFVYRQGNEISRQGTKIQDLANIVTELRYSNQILDRRLQLEMNSRLNTIIPIFKWDHKSHKNADTVCIYFYNVGCAAKNIVTDESIDAHYKVHLVNREASTGELVQIDISMKDGTAIENINFNVIATAISGAVCKQNILKNVQHDFQIGFPEYHA